MKRFSFKHLILSKSSKINELPNLASFKLTLLIFLINLASVISLKMYAKCVFPEPEDHRGLAQEN